MKIFGYTISRTKDSQLKNGDKVLVVDKNVNKSLAVIQHFNEEDSLFLTLDTGESVVYRWWKLEGDIPMITVE